MRLSDYLSRENLTIEQFGRLIGRSGASVSRIARGKQRPDYVTIEKITEATGGAVTPNDHFDTDSTELPAQLTG